MVTLVMCGSEPSPLYSFATQVFDSLPLFNKATLISKAEMTEDQILFVMFITGYSRTTVIQIYEDWLNKENNKK